MPRRTVLMISVVIVLGCGLAGWAVLRDRGDGDVLDGNRPGQTPSSPPEATRPSPSPQSMPPATAEVKPLAKGEWPEEPLEEGQTVLVVKLKLPKGADGVKAMVDVWQDKKLKGHYVVMDKNKSIFEGAYASVRNCRPGDAMVRVVPETEEMPENGLASDWVKVRIPEGPASQLELSPVVVPAVQTGVRVEPVLPPKSGLDFFSFYFFDVTGMDESDAGLATMQSGPSSAKRSKEVSLYAGRTYRMLVVLNGWRLLEPRTIKVPQDVTEAKRQFADRVIKWPVDLGTLVECRVRIQQPDGQTVAGNDVTGHVVLRKDTSGPEIPVSVEKGTVRFWTGLTQNIVDAGRIKLTLAWDLVESYEVVSGDTLEVKGKEVVMDLVLRPKVALVFRMKNATAPAQPMPGSVYLFGPAKDRPVAEASSDRALYSFPTGKLKCLAFAKGYSFEEFEVQIEPGRNFSKDVPMKPLPAKALRVSAPQSSGKFRAHVRYIYPAYPFIPVQRGKVEGENGSGQTQLGFDPSKEIVLVVRDWDMKHAPTVLSVKGAELPEEIVLKPGCTVSGQLKIEGSLPKETEVALMFVRLDAPAAGLVSAYLQDLKPGEDGALTFAAHLDAARYLPVAVVRAGKETMYHPLKEIAVPASEGAQELPPMETKFDQGMTQRELFKKYMPMDWD